MGRERETSIKSLHEIADIRDMSLWNRDKKYYFISYFFLFSILFWIRVQCFLYVTSSEINL